MTRKSASAHTLDSAIDLVTRWNSLPIIALLAVTFASGALLSIAPLMTFAALAGVVAMVYLWRLPKPVATFFIVFLVLQDPLIFFAGGEDTGLGTIFKRADEFLLLLFAVFALTFSTQTRSLLRNRALTLSIAGCYLGMVASTVARPAEPIPALVDLLLFSKPFLLLAIGASLVPSDDEIAEVRPHLLAAMLAVVLFAIVFLVAPQLQDAYIGDFRGPDERVGVISAQGFFDGPGPYAWFCVVTFAFAYAAYLTLNRKPYLVVAMISAAFLLLSWRRKSIAGLFVIVFLSILLKETGQRRRLRAISALVLLGLVVLVGLVPYIEAVISYTVREYGGADPYTNARVALHYTAMLIARDYFPLGTGLASFGSHASRIYYSSVYFEYGLSNVWGLSPQFSGFITDTFWPMVVGEGGVVSLISYVCFLGVLIRVAWQTAKDRLVTPELRFFGLFVLFVLVGSLLESTSSHIYDATMQSSFVMIPAGALLIRRSKSAS